MWFILWVIKWVKSVLILTEDWRVFVTDKYTFWIGTVVWILYSHYYTNCITVYVSQHTLWHTVIGRNSSAQLTRIRMFVYSLD